ncbi:MAG: hypothetical protein KDI79_02730 [Anaerolineae bacterium]|nr:hypothetical protein [Anaerolineae bacterium]
MISEPERIDIKTETAALAHELGNGSPQASHHLARLIEADTTGVFQPFAQALAARLREVMERWGQLGVTDPEITLEDEIYHLLKETAVDWDGWLHPDQT